MAVLFKNKIRVIRENGEKCPVCARKMWHPVAFGTDGAKGRRATVDHIRPKSKGGSDKLKNLRAICESCNVKRGNMLIGQRPVTINIPREYLGERDR